MLSFTPPEVDLTVERRLSAKWIGTPGSLRARRRYRFDHIADVVGKGHEDFTAARQAVRRFDMCRLGWVRVDPTHPTPSVGTQYAVVARIGPIWSTSIARLTSVEESSSRLSITAGTTKDHVAKGEERFEVVIHDNGDVVFSITAVSRPARWYTWLGYPFMRLSQARFRRGAVKAMKAAVRK